MTTFWVEYIRFVKKYPLQFCFQLVLVILNLKSTRMINFKTKYKESPAQNIELFRKTII